MKIKLEKDRLPEWHAEGHVTKRAKLSLPYYQSRRGKYIHRVRYMNQHWRDNKFHHANVGFWCGGLGFPGEKGILMAEVPQGQVLCATCEGRAIGAGEDGSHLINGREVIYSPRRDDCER